MLNILQYINKLIKFILIKNNLFIKNVPLIITTTKLEIFGDYQIIGLFSLSKILNKNIKSISNLIYNNLNKKSHIFIKIICTNNNFINLFINNKYLSKQLNSLLFSKFNLPINKYFVKQTIILDYSSPNIAKEMHIGHLRSTVIGDAMSKILTFLGHKIIKINHLGDWGRQLGLLIGWLMFNKKTILIKNYNIKQLTSYYQQAYLLAKNNNKFNKYVNYCTLKLQTTNMFNNLWKKIIKKTIIANQNIYKKLNVSLNIKNIYGESFYKHLLFDLIKDLLSKKLIINNKGALISKRKLNNNENHILILKKTDGGYLYATTDLASIKYRYERFNPDQILYFIDNRQNLHLQHVIKLARLANYIPHHCKIEHQNFGIILNKNNKPFKTRDGKLITLSCLIDIVIKKTKTIFLPKLKNKIKSIKQQNYIINSIGIGALKYFELSKKRTINYVFNLNKAITFEGNTSLYIQYAYIRIISILKKINLHNNYSNILKLNKLIILNNHKQLALTILRFYEILNKIALLNYPHLLCQYLYELAKKFTNFYEQNSIIKELNLNKKYTNIQLFIIISHILKLGLELLGITMIDII